VNAFFRSYISAFKGLSVESWMLSLVMLLNRIGSMVIPFLTVYLISVLHFKTDEAGLVMSCFGLGSLTGSILGGWLTDKFGNFWVQFLSLLLTVPIFILLSHLTTVWEVCIAIYIFSSINECFRPANSAAITHYAKKDNITRSFSLNRMAINLGFSFGPALGGFLAAISYMWLFYGNSIASFITAIVFFAYFFNHKERRKEAPSENLLNVPVKILSPYRDKWFLIFSFFCFLFACVFFQLLSILPIFYEEKLNFSQGTIGLLLASNGMFVFVTEMMIVQYLDNRFNIHNNVVIGCLFLLSSFCLLMINDSLFSCFVAMILLSFSEILFFPFTSTITARCSIEKNRGAYMGLNGLSIAAAFVVMPYLATKIIVLFSYQTLWIINIFILSIAALGFYWVKKNMVFVE